MGNNNQITKSFKDLYLDSLYDEEEFNRLSEKIFMPLIGKSEFSFSKINVYINNLNISSEQKAELYNYYEVLNSFYINLITNKFDNTNQALNRLKEILKENQCKAYIILKDKLDKKNPHTDLAFSHDFIHEPLFGLVRYIIIKTKDLSLKSLEGNEKKFEELIKKYSFALLWYMQASPICNEKKVMNHYLNIIK